MKRFTIAWFLIVVFALPIYVSAEESGTYLIYASDEEIELITGQYKNIIKEFEELPMVELELTISEKNVLQEQFSTAEIYPNRQYETAVDTVPPSFAPINSTPAQTSPYTGKGVRVAVLDTGIDTEHPDLSVAGGVCIAEVCSESVPYDDDNGHGTHVAGIIAAKKNGFGTVGISPNINLYSIKAMNNRGTGSTAQVTEGVEWAIQNNIDILNLSISITVNDRPLELMLQKAYDKGMLIVAAAGNEGVGNAINTVTYPGKFSSVIAVGAVQNDMMKEVSSSIGPELEMAAPGYLITSTYPKELDEWDGNKNGYRNLTGTSMATPHVTGVLALYKEQNPGFTNRKLREILSVTAKDLGAAGRDEKFGFGLVQYKKEIKSVPFIQTAVTKGKVELTLKNPELASGWSMTKGKELLTETEKGSWVVFLTKGLYKFNFTYTNNKGERVTEGLITEVKEPAFPDVTMSSWFAPYISYLYSNNMMKGYLDGTFRPRKEITRGEALILIGRAHGLDGTAVPTAFKDVGINNNAAGYIQSAYEKGIISGFPDGTFRPDQSVTRAEMALLIYKTYNFDYDSNVKLPFTDVHSEMAAFNAIQAISQNQITNGVTPTTFEPDTYMNRYTFSVFLAKSENENFFQ